jgi:predicted Zn finger-like uncharacterized protein
MVGRSQGTCDKPMKLVCPNCATSYEVATASIGEAGRSVRCVRCHAIWFASPGAEPVVPSEMAPAMASTPSPPEPASPTDLDDMSAWGLPSEPAAPSPEATETAFDPAAMLREIEGTIEMPNAPPLAPVDAWSDGADEVSPAPSTEPSFVRPRDKRLPRPKLRAPSLPTLCVVLAAILAGILGWRADVVRVMPQTASLFAAIGLPVNLRGLAFADVTTSKEVQDGIPVLVIEGRIANTTRMMLEVPRIRLAMRNGAGAEVYSWTALPSRAVLGPGEAQTFRTRLASPPSDGKDVMVRFFNRRDAVGGLR